MPREGASYIPRGQDNGLRGVNADLDSAATASWVDCGPRGRTAQRRHVAPIEVPRSKNGRRCTAGVRSVRRRPRRCPPRAALGRRVGHASVRPLRTHTRARGCMAVVSMRQQQNASCAVPPRAPGHDPRRAARATGAAVVDQAQRVGGAVALCLHLQRFLPGAGVARSVALAPPCPLQHGLPRRACRRGGTPRTGPHTAARRRRQ